MYDPADTVPLLAAVRLAWDASPRAAALILEQQLVYANPAALALLEFGGTSPNTDRAARLLAALRGAPQLSGLLTATTADPVQDASIFLSAAGQQPRQLSATAWQVQDETSVATLVLLAPAPAFLTLSPAAAAGHPQTFRTIFEASPLGVGITDLEGRFLEVNPMFCRIAGYPRSELIGRHMEEITEQEDLTVNRASRQALLGNRCNTTSFQKRYIHKDGRRVWANLTLSLLRDASGAPSAFLGMVEDITEHRAARQSLADSEARLRLLAEAVPDILFTIDAEGAVSYLSQRIFDYAGAPAIEHLGAWWVSLMHPDDVPSVRTVWHEALQTGRPIHCEFRMRGKDGRYRWFMARALAVQNEAGRVTSWCGACTDVDDAKQLEANLRRMNQDLEQFAHAASHDLQEPLRNISTSLGLIARLYKEDLRPDARELLQSSMDNAQRLHAMISELLRYSQAVVPGSRPDAQADANRALEQALANLSAMVQESGAAIVAGPLPPLAVSDAHLIQLFQNLIGNALKYRAPDRPPHVEVTTELQAGLWRFTISDNGIGFDQRHAEQIFGLFKRLHRDEYDGTGIGLATCARIVAYYGGRIWAESEPGVGSRFYFTLPAIAPT